MKLFAHEDFGQAIFRAAEHFRARGQREAVIEKEYFVTEALRLINQVSGDSVVFKGGTSLSEGWNLIERFSEDIDIFLDPDAFDPVRGWFLSRRARSVERPDRYLAIRPIVHDNYIG